MCIPSKGKNPEHFFLLQSLSVPLCLSLGDSLFETLSSSLSLRAQVFEPLLCLFLSVAAFLLMCPCLSPRESWKVLDVFRRTGELDCSVSLCRSEKFSGCFWFCGLLTEKTSVSVLMYRERRLVLVCVNKQVKVSCNERQSLCRADHPENEDAEAQAKNAKRQVTSCFTPDMSNTT